MWGHRIQLFASIGPWCRLPGNRHYGCHQDRPRLAASAPKTVDDMVDGMSTRNRPDRHGNLSTGDLPPPSVAEAVELASMCWTEGTEARSDQTVTRMVEVARRFERRLEAEEVRTLDTVTAASCEAFIGAVGRKGTAPSIATMRFRRTVIRSIFRSVRSVGHAVGDPTMDLYLPERGPDATRPLTTAEVEHCRTCCERPGTRDLRRTAAWALAEAGAITSEIAQVRRGDLDGIVDPKTVALAGTKRIRARRVSLTGWGAVRLAARVLEMDDGDPSTPLAYGGTYPLDSAAAQAATCRLVAGVLAEAHLGIADRVRPGSVRLWRAKEHFAVTGRIEDAARLLGHRSLDEAAEAVGYDWEQQ